MARLELVDHGANRGKVRRIPEAAVVPRAKRGHTFTLAVNLNPRKDLRRKRPDQNLRKIFTRVLPVAPHIPPAQDLVIILVPTVPRVYGQTVLDGNCELDMRSMTAAVVEVLIVQIAVGVREGVVDANLPQWNGVRVEDRLRNSSELNHILLKAGWQRLSLNADPHALHVLNVASLVEIRNKHAIAEEPEDPDAIRQMLSTQVQIATFSTLAHQAHASK
jgi:hypothetical protein